MALIAASFLLAALCGTIQSTTLTVFLVMGMIVTSSVPAIATGSRPASFWRYGSTTTTDIQYDYSYDPETFTWDYTNRTVTSVNQCEVPLLSYEEGHFYKTPEERDAVDNSEVFQGCYIVAGSPARFGASSFWWYMIPYTHFTAAWSNILGYTSLPGNQFTNTEQSKSPEEIATLALSNFKGGKGYDESNGTSFMSQGSTVLIDYYYDYTQQGSYNYEYEEPKSTCPSNAVVSDICEYTTSCYHVEKGFPSTDSPSLNDDLGYLVSLVVIYSILAVSFISIL